MTEIIVHNQERIVANTRVHSQTYQLPVEGYKPKGWALKRSTFRITVNLLYTLIQEGFYDTDSHQFVPQISKTVTRTHTFTVDGIWGGRYGDLRNKIMGKYNKAIDGFVRQDLEDFEEFEPDWEVTDVEVTDATLERLQ